MADTMSKNPLTQSVFVFLICAVGIVAFLFLIVLPSQKTSDELDREIEALNARIEEQRILTPVFHSLLKRAKTEAPSMLPSPDKTSLTHGDMNAISKEFQEFAARHDLKLEGI
jgi:hypothetical protein